MRILQDILRRQARSNKALAVDTRVRQVLSSSCKEINSLSFVNIYGRNTLYGPILFDFKVGLWILKLPSIDPLEWQQFFAVLGCLLS